MKRDFVQLEQAELEHQQDILLRAKLSREHDAQQARKRRKSKEDSFSERWESNLKEWDELGLCVCGHKKFTIPQGKPPGTSPRYVSIFRLGLELLFDIYQ
jgi:hypothetical protein